MCWQLGSVVTLSIRLPVTRWRSLHTNTHTRFTILRNSNIKHTGSHSVFVCLSSHNAVVDIDYFIAVSKVLYGNFFHNDQKIQQRVHQYSNWCLFNMLLLEGNAHVFLQWICSWGYCGVSWCRKVNLCSMKWTEKDYSNELCEMHCIELFY